MITDFKPGIKMRASVALANLTSFRVGGLAEWFISPTSDLELADSLAWAYNQNLPLTILGAGSNLLISDHGLPGLVICMRHMRGIKFDEDKGQVSVGAGEPIARLAWQAAAKGWSGLEWAVGIPGTVGGLVTMNAGAQGSCAADRLIKIKTISLAGELSMMSAEELGFSYRRSILQAGGRIVTEATFQLMLGFDPKQITASTDAHLKYRHTTQPYNLPSCGSVFRNPYPQAAAQLIEQAGLKGYQIGKAQVSKLHANFIVNCGGATASDIFRLISYVQEKVNQRWSLMLEPEVKFLGHF